MRPASDSGPYRLYPRRDRMEVYRDVLSAVYEKGRDGCSVSSVLSPANLERKVAYRAVRDLVDSGLLQTGPGYFTSKHGDRTERRDMLHVTAAGIVWLEKYRELDSMLSVVGD